MVRLADTDDDLTPLTIRIHHDHILPEDITTFEGIPITTPARTLLDIATSISDEELMAAVAMALDRGLTTRHEIRAVIDRYPEHRGGPRLRALLRRGL
ncbi:MAG: hypothetical protein ACOC3J_01375 [Gemmatimonadota bacterium]